jgi:4-aminobutyrate aminotransferase/(S)-3-amino-2-methylpropionate transaminase
MSKAGLGPLLPSLPVRPPGPASRALAERLRAVESRNVTHFTKEWPVFWEEARGCNVRDADGNVYLDLTGAFGVALLGHGHPGVVEAARAQAGCLVHGMGDVHPPGIKVRLMERLAAIAPWPDARTVLSSTGSEAVETALKTAQVATGRPGVLAFHGSYHGLTLGALATTDRDHFRAPFEKRLYGGVGFAPFPDPLRHGKDAAQVSLDRVTELFALGAPNGDPIGAVIIEPVQGRAGARVAPDGFMPRLSELAASAGVLVVADEVFTGVGRCGSFFASRRVGLEPDLVCLGKALGGGLPMSACLGPRHVMDAWPETDGEAIHTSTFLGHPLGCAAASAVLDAVDDEGVEGRAQLLGGRLVAELRRALSGVPAVAEVRGLGLLIGIELTEGRDHAPAEGAAARVARFALKDGLLVLPSGASGHVVGLTPPVELTDDQMRFAVRILARTIREATS